MAIEGAMPSDVPNEMTVIGIAAPGGPEVLVPQRRPVPVPGPDEVLIKVVAAGVNRPDVMQRQGRYPPPPGASDVPGLEVSGIIVAAGGSAELLIGRRVCALLPGGGYAEYDLIEAAALPETLFTVWSNLFERAYVVEGDVVLVHGGTSGIGTMAISLCKLFDISVIVTCGSDAKCEQAKAWGADHAINYRSRDFVEEVRRITDGQGVQAVLDMVGGDYLPRNIQCLAEDGRHVSIAAMNGPTAEVFIPAMMGKRLTLTGSTLRGFQEPGGGRTDAGGVGFHRAGQAAAGDGHALSAGGGGRRPRADGRGGSFREDRADGLTRGWV